ncbi:MAG: hypothetical protein J1E85_00525 [Ruminococcus sp.]|nr:hypothetical protein [Ruminococcus sp.]
MKAKKSLSKAKRIVVSTMAAVCALSSVAAITAGAVEKVQTDDVYMMGYKLYGSVTAYPTSAQGYTYCERSNTNTGKSALTYFTYYDKLGGISSTRGGTPDLDYKLDTGLSATAKLTDTGNFKSYAGAMTISRVYYKDQPHYNWTSEGTDTELRLGVYKR